MDATTTTGPSTREVRIAAPLFIPATKEGRLATRLRAEEEILGTIMGWKYKVVERGADS